MSPLVGYVVPTRSHAVQSWADHTGTRAAGLTIRAGALGVGPLGVSRRLGAPGLITKRASGARVAQARATSLADPG